MARTSRSVAPARGSHAQAATASALQSLAGQALGVGFGKPAAVGQPHVHLVQVDRCAFGVVGHGFTALRAVGITWITMWTADSHWRFRAADAQVGYYEGEVPPTH